MTAAAKTVAQKLQIKPDTTVWTSHPAYRDLLGPLPAGVGPATKLGDATVAVIFTENESALRKLLDKHATELAAPAALWVAYPKANRIDINRDTLWPILIEYGMRPISQVSLDGVWSLLRFRALREGEEPPTLGS